MTNQTHFQVAMLAFNTILLNIAMLYLHGIICAAPGF